MRMYSNIFRVLCIIILAFTFAWSTSCGSVSLTSIVVTPEAASIVVGATQQFTATGVHADGSTVDITATVTWASSDAAVAAFETPDTNGLATAVAAGTVTISAADTESGLSGSTDMTVAALSGTIASLYTNNANWNDYLANDGTDLFTASDTACDAATAGPGYYACLNGGFFRSVEVTGRGVCDGLTATDSLGAFNWVCDSNTNDVRMVSVGFADGMGMSDLIDFDTAAWKQLNVTVYRSGNAYLATDMATWWGNTIVVNNTGAAMNEGEVHIVTSNPNAKYTIGSNKVALLVKPGVTMNGLGAIDNVIEILTQSFLWIEGAINSLNDLRGINAEDVKFSVVHATEVGNSQNDCIRFHNVSKNNKIAHTKVYKCGNNGVHLDAGADSNTLHDILASSVAWAGVSVKNSAGNILYNITSMNNVEGLEGRDGAVDNIALNVTVGNNDDDGLYIVNSSNNNVFINVSAPNTGSFGIFYGNTSDGNTLMNATAVNQASNGIWLNSSSSATFANIAIAYTGTTGINLVNSNNNYFTGLLKAGNNTVDCAATGIDPGIDNNCDPQGPISDFGSPVTGIDPKASFVAKAASDSVNANGATGTEAFGNITDWINFENIFRGWGKDGSIFPNVDNTDPCIGGTCRIWDWSLVSADTIIRDVLSLPTGSDTLTHTWSNASTTTFLRNVVEIFDDGIGNENGLCESNETCLYTPNIGSYQGHGNLISAGAFTDGTITGVTLMQYETNGR